MSDRAALAQAVRENPTDLVARLVFADWLDEFGENDRDRAIAEYLRLCSDALRRPGGSKKLPPRVYQWLCDPPSPHYSDRKIGFPLPGAPAIMSQPRYGITGEKLPTVSIVAPAVCNWHRLIPTVLALDSWAKLPLPDQQIALFHGYRPTPRFRRDGCDVRVRLTLPGMDDTSFSISSQFNLCLTFSAAELVCANHTMRERPGRAVMEALRVDLPFVNPHTSRV